MASDLSIYVGGEYRGRALASAKQVALHTDEAEYTLSEACRRFGFGGLQTILEDTVRAGRDPKAVRVSVRDDNSY